MTPRTLLLVWVLLSILGAGVIALPDDDARVVSFTVAHGPAPLDLAGMALLGLGLLAYVLAMARAWRGLAREDAALALAAYVPGVALTGWSVATDAGAWWMLGAAIATLAMGFAAWRAALRPRGPGARPDDRAGRA